MRQSLHPRTAISPFKSERQPSPSVAPALQPAQASPRSPEPIAALAAAERFGHRLEALPPPTGGAAPIQRTKYEWDGGKWTLHSTANTDVDAHPHPDTHGYEDLEVGDRYDRTTGTLERRAQNARGRLRRATKRSEKRAAEGLKRKRDDLYAHKDFSEVSKKKGNREELDTPFGKMRFGRGMYNTQPFGTLDPEDWPEEKSKKGKEKKPAHNYDELPKEIESSGKKGEILDEMLGFMSSTGPPTPSLHTTTRAQKASATGLVGLLSVAEPHQLRNPTGGKTERAALRHAKKHPMKNVFNRKTGAYVPAWNKSEGAPIGGTGGWREMRQGKRPIPQRTLDLLDEMSASSAGESEEESESGSESEPEKIDPFEAETESENEDPSEPPPRKKKKPN